ncbi:DUF58 domain-containing protein [Halorussus limi]|uniref:DUF58 domain-containing protein n=1 Tax=Halorussus limi TaxID=2938695 RepID=A0A8U0HXZ0_9EURY|nr:DUF58 domain-containing protein [Halorussus limi]UPV75613.1 DUF58 domain-containing protein [Halorussus limi]
MNESWRTGRWNGAVAFVFCATAVGVYFDRPALLLVSIVGVGFAAYPYVTREPPTEFGVERRLDATTPEHGSRVTVTVGITNESDRYAPNVQVVDGVPELLTVASGTARHATALESGESAQFSYELRAKHGEHRFRPVTVVTGDVSGGKEIELRATSDAKIACLPRVSEVPLPDRLVGAGRASAAAAGDGVEFHRTRTYRHGDPPSRIDWRRFARTGDLSTVEYREDRVASVVVCLDARRVAYCRSGDGEPHAVSYGVAAAKAIATAFRRQDHRVGLAVFGPAFRWVAPSARGGLRTVLGETADGGPLLSPDPPDETDDDPAGNGDEQATKLAAKLTRRDQLVVVSPLVDEEMADAIQRLRRRCKAAFVVSPDVTSDATTGAAVGRLRRANRIAALERSNVRVVDWSPDGSLNDAFRRTIGRHER